MCVNIYIYMSVYIYIHTFCNIVWLNKCRTDLGNIKWDLTFKSFKSNSSSQSPGLYKKASNSDFGIPHPSEVAPWNWISTTAQSTYGMMVQPPCLSSASLTIVRLQRAISSRILLRLSIESHPPPFSGRIHQPLSAPLRTQIKAPQPPPTEIAVEPFSGDLLNLQKGRKCGNSFGVSPQLRCDPIIPLSKQERSYPQLRPYRTEPTMNPFRMGQNWIRLKLGVRFHTSRPNVDKNTVPLNSIQAQPPCLSFVLRLQRPRLSGCTWQHHMTWLEAAPCGHPYSDLNSIGFRCVKTIQPWFLMNHLSLTYVFLKVLSEVDDIRTNAAISLLEIEYGYKIISICYDRIYVHVHVSYIIISLKK